jgi:hypothetical protein
MPRVVRRIHAGFPDLLLEKDFGYHALVLMAPEMALEDRHAPDDRIGEFHHEVDIRPGSRNTF